MLTTFMPMSDRPVRTVPALLLAGLLASAPGCKPSSKEAVPRAKEPATTPAPAATAAGEAPDKPAADDAASAPIFRLPADVRPTRQRVELEVVPDRETFSGRVEIALALDKPRSDLWISARELTLSDGKLTVGGESLALTVEKDDSRGAARLVLPREVPAGSATLSLAFTGSFNPKLVGLYRVKTGERWYAFTQFEAVDARRAFPCFDEPSFKIPWEVVMTVPKGAVAVSNYPVKEEAAAGELRRVTFEPTRPLPSYLVAVAVGEFDVVTPAPLPPNEVRKRPLPVRGIAPKGRGPELATALHAAGELLVMLERWFGIEFPYPKLDHVAVPDFEYGAMENAGIITYREPLLLVDPKTASEDQKLRMTVTVAHEISHQWFGDLVTMQWWDDLWLNESFASVMETQTTVEWAPQNRWDLINLSEVQGAMRTDELSTVRPIRPNLVVEGDIFGFDYQIAYQKGSQVIAMFEQFLGPEAFRAGVRGYLAAHADRNATRDDLVAALSEQGTDIRAAMRSFIDQPGIPLVQATLRCEGGPPRVALKQSRNLPLGSTASRDVRWSVPVCVRSAGPKQKPDCMLLATAEAELPLARKSCPAWIALNPEAHGYYRWALAPAQLKDLLTSGYKQLTPAERLSLASNLSSGLRSGALPAADVLAALGPLARDPEPSVAQEPGGLLAFVREKLVEPGLRGTVEAHMRSLYGPVLAKVGWKSRAGEPARVQSFRRWLIAYLAFTARDPAVLERAAGLGRAYVGTDGHVHPEAVDRNIVSVAVQAAGRLGSPELFDTMLERLASEQDSVVRGHLLGGLAEFQDPKLADRARALAFDERLRVNERLSVLQGQAQTLEQKPAAWAWLVANFDKIAPVVPPAYVQFFSYLQDGCSEDAAVELERFMRPRVKSHIGGPYNLDKALEYTRLCAAQVTAQRRSATEFFNRSAQATQAPAQSSM